MGGRLAMASVALAPKGGLAPSPYPRYVSRHIPRLGSVRPPRRPYHSLLEDSPLRESREGAPRPHTPPSPQAQALSLRLSPPQPCSQPHSISSTSFPEATQAVSAAGWPHFLSLGSRGHGWARAGPGKCCTRVSEGTLHFSETSALSLSRPWHSAPMEGLRCA